MTCQQAAQLPRDPARHVLLLEAGPDYPTLKWTQPIAKGWRVSLQAHD